MTFLPPQEHVKYDAFQNNGKRLQRGGPQKTAEWEACITEPWRPLPLQPFLDTASSTVFYELLEVLWTPRFTYSCACFGARILRCVGGTKGVQRERPFGGPPTPRILGTPGHAQECVKHETEKGERICVVIYMSLAAGLETLAFFGRIMAWRGWPDHWRSHL